MLKRTSKLRNRWKLYCSLLLFISFLSLVVAAKMSLLHFPLEIPSSGSVQDVPVTWLRTDGVYLKNIYNQTVYLTGVHWADLVDSKARWDTGPGGGPLNGWRVNLTIRTGVAKEIGANHIRYSIKLERYVNPFNATNKYVNYVQYMDDAVQELINYNLYGYFVLHYGSGGDDDLMQALLDNSPWTFEVKEYVNGTWEVVDSYTSPAVRDDWMVWCQELANHYKDIPNVFGFQIWAEPGWGRFSSNRTAENYEILFEEWRQFNMETAQAIQRGNPKAITIVMSPGYYWVSYMSPKQWDGRTLPLSNIMYGVQKYESEDHRGGLQQKAYWNAYKDWHYGGNTTLEEARALQEQWYLYYVLDFALDNNVPVINNEMAYSDDLAWNYKDNVDWGWCTDQAQGFYDIWKKYQQGWTQHRWQKGKAYGGGSTWGFFASIDKDVLGNYELTPSGQLMSQNFNPLPNPY